MEGERRKRKLERGSHEEENEEQKMEKFFALIKSTKNVHDMLFNNNEKTEKKGEEEDHKGKRMWTPMFQPQDFIDYGGDQLRRSTNTVSTTTPRVAGPSEKEKEVIEKEDFKEATPAAMAVVPAPENHEEKEKASDQLDLNLSL